jgi:hypothetical protein
MTTIGVVFVRHGTRIKLIAILFAYRRTVQKLFMHQSLIEVNWAALCGMFITTFSRTRVGNKPLMPPKQIRERAGAGGGTIASSSNAPSSYLLTQMRIRLRDTS